MGEAVAVVSTVFSVVGQVQQARAQAAATAQQSRADAANLRFQQQQLESAQRDELIAAKQEEAIQRRELNDTLATIDAVRAGRGFSTSSPTFSAITRDIKESAGADIRVNKLNRLGRADALRQQSVYAGRLANFSDANANFAQSQGRRQANFSILSGTAQLAAPSLFGKSGPFGEAGKFGAKTGGQTGFAGFRNRINASRGFYGPGF